LIKELAEYLGHKDPAFTLRVYAHMLPSSYDRARAVISERFAPMLQVEVRSSVKPRRGFHDHGTETEQHVADRGDQ